jgi:hypothetical protein
MSLLASLAVLKNDPQTVQVKRAALVALCSACTHIATLNRILDSALPAAAPKDLFALSVFGGIQIMPDFGQPVTSLTELFLAAEPVL